MSKFFGINLLDILDDEDLGEDAARKLLSSFLCGQNPDVERFLHVSAIPYARQGISATYLVMDVHKKQHVLVGYFTLANKVFTIREEAIPSSRWKSRIKKFAQYDNQLKQYVISTPLIGQLGKNFANDYNQLISGDELLQMAVERVCEAQRNIGGRLVYLECEDNENLIRFYTRNGFVNFGKRKLDRDETDALKGQYLIQMLRYL